MKMKRFFYILSLAVACCACQPKLVILHTNDTHSHVEPIRAGELKGLGGAIERAAFIDSVRASVGADRVLLLHAGDFSQGSSYFSELGGKIEMDVINDMQYDAVTLGNHEFDNDIEALTERLKMLKGTKVVCANLDLRSFELGKYVQPYCIIEKGGMKIGIIGLETTLGVSVLRTVADRIPQYNNVEVVNKWENYLHNEEKCDLIILLTHLGYEEDQDIAPFTSYVDLIVGGHSHTFCDDIVYVKNSRGKKVGVISDGQWGLEMGEITVR